MAGGFRLFKIYGITISIDFTWFIVFFLFSWSLAYGYYPSEVPGHTVGAYLVMGSISAFMLFVCVLIHELSHSVTSNKLGVEVKEITLFIFGGVAQLTREPDTPAKELKIAVMGPVASGILALIFYLISIILVNLEVSGPVLSVIKFLSLINVVLLVFNMIPGLPLDGGRILKALWWMKSGNINTATSAAGHVGRAFATFLIFLGFLQMLSGNFSGGLWAILIGVFLMQAAKSSVQHQQLEYGLEGLTVGDIMTEAPHVITVDISDKLDRVVDDKFFHYHFVSFPVMNQGAPVGLLSINAVRNAGRDSWPTTNVLQVMEPLTRNNCLSPGDSVMAALIAMNSTGQGRYVVLKQDTLYGVLSRRDILKTIDFKGRLAGTETKNGASGAG